MSLINSSYFIGETNVPNKSYADVSIVLNSLIEKHEPEYLKTVLGYELFLNFMTGIQDTTPNQRYTDLLLGQDFTGQNGKLKRWGGFISLASGSNEVFINPAPINDFSFVVGVTLGAPVIGDTSYINTSLAGKTYKVTQRGFGPLEWLKDNNSNVATADIQYNLTGGFTWLNGVSFSTNDKYFITGIFDPIDISTLPLSFKPISPIADYVYWFWLKYNHSQTSGLGEVRSEAQNAVRVSPKHKAVMAWNDMVEKTWLLYEFLKVNPVTYPEFQAYLSDPDINLMLTKINTFF